MEGVAALIKASSSHFPLSPSPSPPSHHHHHHPHHASRSTPPPPVIMSTRKRKPIVTYQSPDGGVLDMALLVRNTALEFEAAASRSHNNTTRARASGSSASSSTLSPANTSDDTLLLSNSTPNTPHKHVFASGSVSIYAGRFIPSSFRPIAFIPRAPHPLYHPLSQPRLSKHGSKNSDGRHAESGALSPDTGRRSSSRTRRPAPKMRETENGPDNPNSKDNTAETADKSGGSAKRRRGGVGGGKRKRVEADGDSAYPAVKRSRKRDTSKNDNNITKNDMENVDGADGSNAPPHGTNNDASPSLGYLTRARRPRTAAPQVIKDDSGSDGTGSAPRTTPVNGAAVEEFWVPTKVS